MTKKIFKIIYYIALTFFGVIATLLIISVFSIPGNLNIMVVKSGSMAPTIQMGDIIITKPVANYKVGDIVTFKEFGKNTPSITHRIYAIENNEFITKGDANNTPDSAKVPKRDIVGKVFFHLPYLGFAVETARKPVIFVLVIIIPAIIIIFGELKKIYAEIKKKRKN